MVQEILVEAARHGVKLELDGSGRLAVSAAVEPPPDLLAQIRENTAAIIQHLEFGNSDPAEMFADNVRKSLKVHSEILDHPFDPDDFRMTRIKSDTATAVLSVASRGSPEQLKMKQDGNRPLSPRLLAAVARADAMAEEDRKRAAEKDAARNVAMPGQPGDAA
jgi:hypothetical protein